MKNLEIYEKLYDDAEKILGSEKFIDSIINTNSSTPTDKQLSNWNNYLKDFLNETNMGILKTLLIISKPFNNIDILSETIQEINNRYKYLSKN